MSDTVDHEQGAGRDSRRSSSQASPPPSAVEATAAGPDRASRFRQVAVIAGAGAGPGLFAHDLQGIALDASGRLYAVGDSEVKVFGSQGELQRRWATAGPALSVAVDRRGTVYVGEEGRIETFNPVGKPLDTWRDAERLGRVTAIGFHGEHVLAADAAGRCIRRFDRNGRFINDIGNESRRGGFLIPNGHLDFAVGPDGVVHAAHSGKHRVERYTLTGELLGHFGRFGTRQPEDFPGCCNPTNLTLDREGHIIVTEKAPPRVKVYDAAGGLLAVIGSDAFDPNGKNLDVATDEQGRIYVVDPVRRHICVFGPAADESRPASGPHPLAPEGDVMP